MRLKDEVVMVTGGGSGIGQAACLLFAKEGARVAVGDVVSENAAATSAKIAEAGGWAMHGRIDATNASSVEAFVAEVLRQCGRVDVLVNNVGGPVSFTTVLDSTEPDWDKTLALNVKSVFLVSRLVLPSMIKNKKGAIINIGSMVGLTGWRNRAAYSAAKGAVIALTRAMAADHGQDGVRVNCICPGVTLTPPVLRSMQPDSAFPNGLDQQTLKQNIPIGRLGEPLDIAEAIVFMASNQASWITGAVLPVDGGITAV